MTGWKVVKRIKEIEPLTESWVNLEQENLYKVADGDIRDSAQTSGAFTPGTLTATLRKTIGLSVLDEHMSRLDNNQIAALEQAETVNSSGGRGDPSKCRLYAVLELNKLQVEIETFTSSFLDFTWPLIPNKLDVSRAADLTIRIYLPVSGDSGPGLCLGSGKVSLPSAAAKPVVKWLHLAGGTGKLAVGLEYKKSLAPSAIADIHLTTIVGGGVRSARNTRTGCLYAARTEYKSRVDSWSSLSPQGLRFDIDCSFIAPLHLAFQEPEERHLAFSPFASGGHLFYHLQRARRFDTARARFYAAEIVSALEYLHERDIVCQELCPTNILLDSLGHIIVADFSLHRPATQNELRGAAAALEIPAPELLSGQAHAKSADWWTLGAFLYEMLTGMPPFYAQSVREIHSNISSGLIQLPDISDTSASNFLLRLLDCTPELRLGANGASEVKDHAFFHGIDWQRLLRRQVEPPFKPSRINVYSSQNIYQHLPRKVEKVESDPAPLLKMDKSIWSCLLVESWDTKRFCPPDSWDRLVQTSEGSLLHAVIKGDRDIIQTLVKVADRVDVTKALGLAVERRDQVMVRILLDGGASCDFADSDRPAPPSHYDACYSTGNGVNVTEPEEFLPPLVRAVKLKDVHLVRTLLHAGADPNVGFHDNAFRPFHTGGEIPLIVCGRVIQLALVYDNEEIVQLLLAFGADINQTAPEWQHHNCKTMERSLYFKITALLEKSSRDYADKGVR
ncbi:hypothetical protein PFICI_11924 [Pestalotiopsis fici W106-1]|uniref:Protein kinase domain-containing protein n=1 Tax=Pestalotiopsis fici (strain W106-1 / CGMCC3.15140) TaxID=1229662 RepID=W3WTN9_PESFW|nr:uncharacterized protein PFICI_11924 [Pestalotiopsis fici W106-1]ETS76537.1 hypothetical protein PFICI_11924 [Pestalotiopsis fici W106-1]